MCLSGGGARGVAHIGVLQAFESCNFLLIISGCSAGAMVGALYAAGFNPRDIFKLIEHRSLYSIIKWVCPIKA
ncbi:MAG: patatin-like phospholipase family protein [Bacteroidetes bacterium]|nr:patatin-like phospholipase family protein [Bacteroidota bacterium]